MQVTKCDNCGAPTALNPDGSYPGCQFCGLGVPKTVDAATLTASLGKHIGNVPQFVETLATTLEGAFPGQTQVERKGFLTKHIAEVRIEVKHNMYRLALDGTQAHASRTKVVRGVKLKDETLPLHKWLEELSRGLADIASENQQSHDALQKFLR